MSTPITWLSSATTSIGVGPVGGLDVEAPSYELRAMQLMPHGRAWTRRPGTVMRSLVAASARSFARAHTAIDRLRREIWPGTADELLPAWEAFAGITDPAADLDDRRRAVVAKLFRSAGPLSRERATAIALSLGYTSVTFSRLYRPLKVGHKVGAKLAGSGTVGWQWHVLMRVSPSIPAQDDRLREIIADRAHAFMTVHLLIEG